MNEREQQSVVDSADSDVQAFVQLVMRETYADAVEELRAYAERVRHFNALKSAVRDYISSLGDFKTQVLSMARERGVDLRRISQEDLAVLATIFEEYAHDYPAGAIEYELGIPSCVPPEEVKELPLLDSEIAHWEEKLATIGEDAQLANIDLQNALQRQQMTLQLMSNVSKLIHDTGMAIIRKIG